MRLAGAASRVVVGSKIVRRALITRAMRVRGKRIDRPCLLVSFDCDTGKDIEVVPDVRDRLAQSGIRANYAVPGAILEASPEMFRELACDAELLNHGYAQHTRFVAPTRTYESTLSYRGLARHVIEADVIKGHRSHEAVLGKAPGGFRTPHFGSFDRRRDLTFLWSLLGSLGYRYSSSTSPRHAIIHGALWRVGHGLVEIPLTPRLDHPLQVLDSWSFRFAPGRRVDERDFEDQLGHLLNRLGADRHPLIVNIYADPSQVWDWPGFYKTVERGASFAIPSYSKLLELLDH